MRSEFIRDYVPHLLYQQPDGSWRRERRRDMLRDLLALTAPLRTEYAVLVERYQRLATAFHQHTTLLERRIAELEAERTARWKADALDVRRGPAQSTRRRSD
jgi:hypothetical protein